MPNTGQSTLNITRSRYQTLFFRSLLDVIEAVTPLPMGDLPIGEAQAAWPDKAIWCNFPESLFLAEDSVIYSKALELLKTAYTKGRFVLGITEDFPEERKEDGLSAIAEAIDKYQNGE